MSAAVRAVRRIAATLPLVALAMPVVLVRDCNTQQEHVRTGWSLLADGGWAFLTPALAFAAWRVVRPGMPTLDTVADRLSALQAWTLEAVLGFVGVVFPLLSTLFDTISLRFGFWVQVVGWGLLWVTSAVHAARGLVGLPRGTGGPIPRTVVATWLRLGGLGILIGPAAYGLLTEDVAAGTVAFSVVVGTPMAAWTWALSFTLDTPQARRMTTVLLGLTLAGSIAVATDDAPLFLLVPIGLFTLVAGGALLAQSSDTSAH